MTPPVDRASIILEATNRLILRSSNALTRRTHRLRAWRPTPANVALMLIMALAAGLYLVGLEQNGYGSTYYTAAVKSMSANLSNFFYGSFDPGGFITIDKPPLAFWFQVLSVRLFGSLTPALFAPQVLASLFSVGLLYQLVKRSFGTGAGLLAALFLALTPVSVVVARDNIVDADLVVFQLAAALAVAYAAVNGSWRWVLAAGLLLGLGFEVKMMEAYLVLPALVVAYFLGAPGPRARRLAQLASAGLVCVAVSFAWIAVVDSVSPAHRPYIGSSSNNSALDLALNYNGLQRLFGHGFPDLFAPATPAPSATVFSANPKASSKPGVSPTPSASPSPSSAATATPSTAGQPPSDPGPGSTRLFDPYFGGQVSWWLPLALFGLLAEAAYALSMIRQRTMSRVGPRRFGFALWGVWFVTTAVFMSFAEVISPYYLATLAPAIAALGAVGLVGGWESYHRPGAAGWLFPASIGLTASLQASFLTAYNWPGANLAGPLFVGGWLVAGGLALWRWRHLADPEETDTRVGRSLLVTALVVLLLAPGVWTADSLGPANSGSHPLSGPAGTNSDAPVFSGEPEVLAYLLSNAGSTKFLVATQKTDTAAEFLLDPLESGRPIMAIGGFNGNDPTLTLAGLNGLINKGQVRYVWLPSHNLPSARVRLLYPAIAQPPTATYSQIKGNLFEAIANQCVPVPVALWNSATTLSSTRILPYQLFDCAKVTLVAPPS